MPIMLVLGDDGVSGLRSCYDDAAAAGGGAPGAVPQRASARDLWEHDKGVSGSREPLEGSARPRWLGD